MASLPELLNALVSLKGSDLHLSTNTPPQVRVHGKLQTLDLPVLGPAETKTLAKVANHIAKLSAKTEGVLDLYGSRFTDLALKQTPIGDVWGVEPQGVDAPRPAAELISGMSAPVIDTAGSGSSSPRGSSNRSCRPSG
mgnify:CR=1 FL=1